MATNEKGILGGFSGKVGTVIGSSWNGVDYMRGKPGLVNNPQTEKQQNQRAKVGAMIHFLSPMKEVLRVGFKKQAVRMSGFNAATSYNLAHAIQGFYPDFEIDYSKLVISQGKLPGVLNPDVSSLGSGQVAFTWDDNSSDQGAMPNDRALLLMVAGENGKVFTIMEGNIRMDKSQVISLPRYFSGMEMHCYISFQNTSQTEIADSRYVGSVMV